MSFSAADYSHMARALQLAKKGWFSTHPNPRVGCVIVKDSSIIAEGFHRRAGEPHAERMALANANDSVVGATAYVTLEPCCHFGKTPPCTEGLIEAGIAEVVIAMQDPNPLVAGKGIARLNEAGIKARVGLLEQQAQALNPGFIKRMREQRPYVRCKLASSLDGRTAMASGESVWISSEQSRRDVQFLRAESSAIITGIGTVVEDDPSMNVRLDGKDLGLDDDLTLLQPLRVILDSRLQTSPAAKILNQPGDVMIVYDKSLVSSQQYPANVEIIGLDAKGKELDLKQVLKLLAERQINEALVESGATLAGGFLQAGLLDEIILYQAPHVMGDGARGLFHLPGLDKMSDRIELTETDRRMIGKDVRVTFEVT